MKELTAEEIAANYKNFIEVIETTFEGKRKENLLKMYSKLEERIMLAPASGNINYHNCFPGGYIDHVLRVCNTSMRLQNLWKETGVDCNFTEEELVFSAINHDLGKLGDMESDYYLAGASGWSQKKGQRYDYNPDLPYMGAAERSLFLLQQNNIPMTQNEYFAIKLHDGMYIEGNKAYLFNFPGKEIKTFLPILLHHADHLATLAEKSMVKVSPSKTIKKPNKKSFKSVAENSVSLNKGQSDLFDELFKQ